jgi:hypothetical protein
MLRRKQRGAGFRHVAPASFRPRKRLNFYPGNQPTQYRDHRLVPVFLRSEDIDRAALNPEQIH